jgi:hypothetical protein
MISDYRQRAVKLGHSLELLDAGQGVTSTVKVETVDELKALMEKLGITQPTNTNSSTSKSSTDPNDPTVIALLNRVNAFVYGTADLSDNDRALIAKAFPIYVETASYANFTPTAPVIYDKAPYSKAILNAGTLTLNQGIYISAYRTSLQVCVDEFVRNGTSGTHGDINILGATGANGGPVGDGGQPPIQGWGADGNGLTGLTGGTGNAGQTGLAGAPSMDATINIYKNITGTITVYNCSGTGGSGSQGGKGGTGGQGGYGRPGNNWGCYCEVPAGNAGQGGVGGNGGTGGAAFDGINAFGNIYVNVPTHALKAAIKPVPTPSNPGTPGLGGGPGAGGGQGYGGPGGKNCANGGPSTGGKAGTTGATGAAGKTGTAAPIIINSYS